MGTIKVDIRIGEEEVGGIEAAGLIAVSFFL